MTARLLAAAIVGLGLVMATSGIVSAQVGSPTVRSPNPAVDLRNFQSRQDREIFQQQQQIYRDIDRNRAVQPPVIDIPRIRPNCRVYPNRGRNMTNCP